jgi:hypothetical protein
LGTFLPHNKKVPRPPGRDPALAINRANASLHSLTQNKEEIPPPP